MTPQHNKKADHSSDRPAYMIEFKLCLTHASVGYSSSKNVVLRIPFQNIRPSEDSLFCCVWSGRRNRSSSDDLKF